MELVVLCLAFLNKQVVGKVFEIDDDKLARKLYKINTLQITL